MRRSKSSPSSSSNSKSTVQAKSTDLSVFCRKQNASERINLQDIMQLRTAFLAADKDHGGALDLEEFTLAFGKVLGQGLNKKQLNQLFMRIDADSNGDVGK